MKRGAADQNRLPRDLRHCRQEIVDKQRARQDGKIVHN